MEYAKFAVNELLAAGADKASANVTKSVKYEMNVDSGDMSLIRTTQDVSIVLTSIKDNKKGTSALNTLDRDKISAACHEAVSFSAAAQPDDANDIAPAAPAEVFTSGPEHPDREKMYMRLNEFLRDCRSLFPKTTLNSVYFTFNHHCTESVNSNGVDYTVSRGFYTLSVMGMGVDGDRSGSFNGTGFSSFDLEHPIIEYAAVRDMLRMCSEQIETSSIGDKFEGDVIFTPDCLESIVDEYISTFLSDSSLISGSSILKASLDTLVASPSLTIRSTPTDPKMSGGYSIFDGFKAENEVIIENGILRAFDLSQYGARKSGLPRSKSGCGAICVDAGDTNFCDMLRSVKRGLLVCRFSGGNPTPSGDMTGVAKNSYYIENGEIKFPISETMISCNLNKMFKSIGAVSKERTDFGSTILPSVLIHEIKITG